MNNTILLSGKGIIAGLILRSWANSYPNSYLTLPKLKWHHKEVRYELRIQNLDYDEICLIKQALSESWARDIKMEVF